MLIQRGPITRPPARPPLSQNTRKQPMPIRNGGPQRPSSIQGSPGQQRPQRQRVPIQGRGWQSTTPEANRQQRPQAPKVPVPSRGWRQQAATRTAETPRAQQANSVTFAGRTYLPGDPVPEMKNLPRAIDAQTKKPLTTKNGLPVVIADIDGKPTLVTQIPQSNDYVVYHPSSAGGGFHRLVDKEDTTFSDPDNHPARGGGQSLRKTEMAFDVGEQTDQEMDDGTYKALPIVDRDLASFKSVTVSSAPMFTFSIFEPARTVVNGRVLSNNLTMIIQNKRGVHVLSATSASAKGVVMEMPGKSGQGNKEYLFTSSYVTEENRMDAHSTLNMMDTSRIAPMLLQQKGSSDSYVVMDKNLKPIKGITVSFNGGNVPIVELSNGRQATQATFETLRDNWAEIDGSNEAEGIQALPPEERLQSAGSPNVMVLDTNGKESAVLAASSRYPGLSVGITYNGRGKPVYSAFNPYAENNDLETSQRDLSTQRPERTTVAQTREEMEFLQETSEKNVFNVFRASAPRTVIRKVRYNPETQELTVVEREFREHLPSHSTALKPAPPPPIEDSSSSSDNIHTGERRKKKERRSPVPTPQAEPISDTQTKQTQEQGYSLDLENMSAKRQRIYQALDERFREKIDEFVRTFTGRPSEMPRSWDMKPIMNNFRHVYQIRLNDGERVTLSWNPETKKISLFQMLGHT